MSTNQWIKKRNSFTTTNDDLSFEAIQDHIHNPQLEHILGAHLGSLGLKKEAVTLDLSNLSAFLDLMHLGVLY